MIRKTLLVFSLPFLMSLLACSGFQTRVKNEAALANVKKVAVTGFCVVQPKPPMKSGGGGIVSQSPESSQMYDSVVKAFSDKTKWKVSPPSLMKKNPGYVAAYDRTMKGFQNKYPVSSDQQKYTVESIMDNDSLRILGVEGRNALMKALGVDALITAQVDVFLKGNTVMGIGSRYPQARLSFQLYTPNADRADWFEGNLEGEEAKVSVGKTAFIDEKILNEQALLSARSAFNKIGSNPKE